MAESLLKNIRIIFPKGEQKRFLFQVKNRTGLNWKLLARNAGVSQRTIMDWKREKYTMTQQSLSALLSVSQISMPKYIERKQPFYWVKEASVIGGKAMYKKYGQIGTYENRRKGWEQWWQKIGKYNHNSICVRKNIKKPKKTHRLAEFVGIMLGDGSITSRQVCVTLNHIADKQYSLFVRRLIQDLFGVDPSYYCRPKRSTITISVSRTGLVEYCMSIGLPVGNKIRQQIRIPEWIFLKKSWQKACIRGLMDTDGCIFQESHKVKGRLYGYPRLSIVSASKPLRLSMQAIFTRLDFFPKIRNNRSVQLERWEDIDRFFRLIGVNNQKHQKRWRLYRGGVG